MATVELHTYTDIVEHLLDWFGTGTGDAQLMRKAKRAVENAYRQLVSVRQWSYYQSRGLLQTVADQTDGTIAYDHTGGTYERMVTLTSSTWPSWAKFGVLRIGNVDYEIATRESSTELTLSVNSNPGADVTAGESYTLFRDTYPCPVDLLSIGPMRDSDNELWPEYVAPNDFVGQRYVGQTPTFPRTFTIASDQNYLGSMAFKLWPPPDDAYSYDYMYIRRPRNLGIYQYNTGTVTTSSTTLTGTSTVFTSSMIGSVVRFSSSTSLAPTSTVGSNPYVEQRVITSWTSSTVMGLDQALSSELTGVKYEISDPIDLEATAMYTAFLKRCEWEMAQMMNRDDVSRLYQQYQIAERTAMEADSRHNAPGGGGNSWRRVPLTWTLVQDSS